VTAVTKLWFNLPPQPNGALGQLGISLLQEIVEKMGDLPDAIMRLLELIIGLSPQLIT